MTLVLDTVAPTTLARLVSGWSVETSIKTAAGFDRETLRDLYRNTERQDLRFILIKGAALQDEREAAHAAALRGIARVEAHRAQGCRTTCSFPGRHCTGLSVRYASTL